MIAIALTGLPRSGKDTAADYLVKKYGFKKLVLSDAIAEELRKQGTQDTKMSRSRMGKELRERFGDDVIAKRVFEKAGKAGWDKVVFVGPRSSGEVSFFGRNIKRFSLVEVRAGREKRFGRRSKADKQGRAGFFERDKWERKKFGLAAVLRSADHTIENNSTINDLHRSIDELMGKI